MNKFSELPNFKCLYCDTKIYINNTQLKKYSVTCPTCHTEIIATLTISKNCATGKDYYIFTKIKLYNKHLKVFIE